MATQHIPTSKHGFKTGARPAARHKLAAARPHRIVGTTPAQYAAVPKQLSMWGNNQYGDCVSAEEAFAKATAATEIFISDQTIINWAGQHGWLNGADLPEVMDAMISQGIVSGDTYKDGGYTSVDYSNEPVLQNAISLGPVKIGIDSSALPSGAGNQQGWYALGGAGQFHNEDHCVSLCGYGPAEFLYQQLGVPLPAALAGRSGYLLFTWSTIGFVDHTWIMSTVGEAWLRNPTTLDNGVAVPQPSPTPPPPPPPSGLTITGVQPSSGPAGTVLTITGTGFTSTSGVVIGNQVVPAALSNSGLNCTVPTSLPAGTYDVTVTQGGASAVAKGAFTLVPPPPPPPPAPIVLTGTVHIPKTPLASPFSFMSSAAMDVPVSVSNQGVGGAPAVEALPPWLMILLKFGLQYLCSDAPNLPPPYNIIVAQLCATIFPADEPCGCGSR